MEGEDARLEKGREAGEGECPLVYNCGFELIVLLLYRS